MKLVKCQKPLDSLLPPLILEPVNFLNLFTQIFGVHSRVESFDGYRYYVTFVDDYSRVTWLYLLKLKSDLFDAFKDFHNLITNHFSSKLYMLRSDNSTEYTSNNMSNYLSNYGILQQTSCVGTPQQNGVAERKNRDLLEKTRSLMIQMHVPKKFGSQACTHCHLHH